jgi:hypothetical protein
VKEQMLSVKGVWKWERERETGNNGEAFEF